MNRRWTRHNPPPDGPDDLLGSISISSNVLIFIYDDTHTHNSSLNKIKCKGAEKCHTKSKLPGRSDLDFFFFFYNFILIFFILFQNQTTKIDKFMSNPLWLLLTADSSLLAHSIPRIHNEKSWPRPPDDWRLLKNIFFSYFFKKGKFFIFLRTTVVIVVETMTSTFCAPCRLPPRMREEEPGDDTDVTKPLRITHITVDC